jgi:hypothetical protein
MHTTSSKQLATHAENSYTLIYVYSIVITMFNLGLSSVIMLEEGTAVLKCALSAIVYGANASTVQCCVSL